MGLQVIKIIAKRANQSESEEKESGKKERQRSGSLLRTSSSSRLKAEGRRQPAAVDGKN